MYSIDRRTKGVGTTAKFDEKILREAKKRRYDGIIYTKPAPPARMEVVVFSEKNIKEKT